MAQAGCMPPSRQRRTSSSLDELAMEGSRAKKGPAESAGPKLSTTEIFSFNRLIAYGELKV
jgi:hypothetical protein